MDGSASRCDRLKMAAAMDAVAVHPPDILPVDISLSVTSGFIVAEKLREIALDVKIVFVTARRDRAYVKRAFDIGVKDYVLKSSIGSELLSAIREIAEGGVYCSGLLG